MKNTNIFTTVFSFFMLSALPLAAQISITFSDINSYYTIGNVLTTQFDEDFDSDVFNTFMYNIGQTGGGNTWDFQSVELLGSEDQMVIAPGDAFNPEAFPDANFVTKIEFSDDEGSGSIFNFMHITNNQLSTLGSTGEFQSDDGDFQNIGTYSPTRPIYNFPISFEDDWSYTGTFTSQTIFGGMNLPATPSTVERSAVVDAFGTLILPNGKSAQAIRIREVSTISTEVVPGFPTSTTDVSFTFITKDGDILTIDAEETGMDIPSQGTIEGNLSWTSTNAASSVRDINAWGFQLNEIQPNPAQEQAQLQYYLPEAEQVKVLLFDQYGKLVRTLQQGQQVAGDHIFTFDVEELASGVYYTSLLARGGVITKKLLVQR